MNALIIYSVIVLFYFLILNGTYLLLTLISFFSLRQHRMMQKITYEGHIFRSEFYKPISLIIPAYNEESTIVETLFSALSLSYPEYEVVAVNDGSSDETLAELKRAFSLQPSARDFTYEVPCQEIRQVYRSLTHPHLVVLDKINGGKSDALNAGVNVSQFPIFCNTDADSVLDSSSLIKLVDPFVRDRRVVAVGGTIRVANHCEISGGRITKVLLSPRFWVRFQVVEYLRAFLFGRMGWSTLGGVLILSGAFSIFRRRTVIEAGGYSKTTVGEDMELVLRMQRTMKENKKDYRIVFLPDPVCWTQVPEDAGSLSRQRRRWQRGLSESLIANFPMFFNPQYGATGMISFPFYFFFEFLGPVIELSGYIIFIVSLFMGILHTSFVVLFLMAAILLGVLLSTSAIFFEVMFFRNYYNAKDVLVLFIFSILENFGYRQLHTWWRFRGIIEFLFRRRNYWGEISRHQFNKKEDNQKAV